MWQRTLKNSLNRVAVNPKFRSATTEHFLKGPQALAYMYSELCVHIMWVCVHVCTRVVNIYFSSCPRAVSGEAFHLYFLLLLPKWLPASLHHGSPVLLYSAVSVLLAVLGGSHTQPVPLPCWDRYCPLVPGGQPSFSVWDSGRPSRAVPSEIPGGFWWAAAVSCIEWVFPKERRGWGASKPVQIRYSEWTIGLFLFRETQVARPLLWRGLVHMKPNLSLSDTP